MILLAYRHGLRVSELVSLRRKQPNLRLNPLYTRRRRTGCPPPTHYAGRNSGPYARCCATIRKSPNVFISERRARMSAANFRKLLARAGDATKLGTPIDPHMFRHSTGFKLANDGQDIGAIRHYLGHKNTQHTVLYAERARPLKGLTHRRLRRRITPTH